MDCGTFSRRTPINPGCVQVQPIDKGVNSADHTQVCLDVWREKNPAADPQSSTPNRVDQAVSVKSPDHTSVFGSAPVATAPDAVTDPPSAAAAQPHTPPDWKSAAGPLPDHRRVPPKPGTAPVSPAHRTPAPAAGPPETGEPPQS